MIKKKIEYLINKYINEDQRGFRAGKGTQTRLSAHYDSTYDTKARKKIMVIAFLNYAKAHD